MIDVGASRTGAHDVAVSPDRGDVALLRSRRFHRCLDHPLGIAEDVEKNDWMDS